jgi:glycosyltransferase involved in cell wall biosynthesis
LTGDDVAVSVSVIVPCRNAARLVGEALASLVNQELDEAAEILLVDNGSTDNSRAVAAGIRGRIPLRIIEARARTNASYARNEGVRHARGDKLMFVDADDQVAPGYLAAMAAALERHRFVTSRVDSRTLNEPWIRDAHGPPWQAEAVTVFFDFLPATGINIGLRRDLFDMIGGFPEDFSGSQDIVFSWRAQQLGVTIAFIPEALYLYRYRATLRGLFRQCRNWGTSNVLLYRMFRTSGMPPRTMRVAVVEWRDVLREIVRARSRAQLAPLVTRLGYCAGRLAGSFRYRCLYL